MNIAKALKQKNRLVGDINRLWTTVKSRNTINFDEGTEDLDVIKDRDDELLRVSKELTDKQEELITLKTAIQVATLPITSKLIKLAEVKSQIKQWESLGVSPLVKRKVTQRYGTEETTVISKNFFTYDDIESSLKSLRKLAETLQDEIDDHNGRTTVVL